MDLKVLQFYMHKEGLSGVHICLHNKDTVLLSPHSHKFYEFFFVVSGSCTHNSNGKVEDLEAGVLIFLRPGDAHGFSDPSDDFTFYNIAFSLRTAGTLFSLFDKELVEKVFLSSSDPVSIRIVGEEQIKLRERLQKDVDLIDWDLKSLVHVEILISLFSLLISNKRDNKDDYPNWFSNLLVAIDQDKNYIKGVDHLYALATRSREHVSRTFKNLLGVTPTEYINNKKLDYAANLLRQTSIEIIDVALSSGFSSQSNFYSNFKEKFGITPRKFRQEGHLYI